MNDNDELLAAVPAQDGGETDILEIDDVEGHGLREVAAGLGAAAVLAGGASAAMASTGPHLPQVHPSTGITQTASAAFTDPVGTLDRTTDQGLDTARDARDSAIQTAGQTASSSVRTATGAADTALDMAAADVKTASNLATSVKTSATSTATGAVSATQRTADRAVTTARSDVADVSRVATGAVSSTTATASSTVNSTVRDADRKVATVLSVTTKTATGGIQTATATLRAVNAGAGVDAASAGGWVLVKAGDAVLAQVHLSGGTATASWKIPAAGAHSITVSYTGDDFFAPTMRTIDL